MKNILLTLLLFWGFLFAQTRTIPQDHHWVRIYDGVLGKNGDADTSSAFSARQWRGTLTLVCESDTGTVDVSGTSDSCLTIWMQLKRKYVYPGNQVVDQDWMTYYNSSDAQKVRIDTVARSLVNGAGSVYYINIPVEQSSTGEWAWADSVRFIFGIGVGDSLGTFKADCGGQ